MRQLLRADGTTLDIQRQLRIGEIEALIGADTTDRVLLIDRVHVMILDDRAAIKGLPVNRAATTHYYAKCGGEVAWCICGDVVIVPDSDFATHWLHDTLP
jgi:Domain of unknown function (DUF3846)